MNNLFFCKFWKFLYSEWKGKKELLKEEERREWVRIAKNIKKSNNQDKNPETRITQPINLPFILSWLRYLFLFLYFFSFSYWISQSHKKQEKINTQLDFKPYRSVDIYVMAWLLLEVLSAIAICIFDLQWVAFIVVFSYRLFDIFQSWVSQFILSSEWNAINVNRSLVLAFMSYIEITVIGAIIRLTCNGGNFWDAVYESVNTMIANPGNTPSPIQYVQIMFAILFAAAVVQHVVGRLSVGRGGQYE